MVFPLYLKFQRLGLFALLSLVAFFFLLWTYIFGASARPLSGNAGVSSHSPGFGGAAAHNPLTLVF